MLANCRDRDSLQNGRGRGDARRPLNEPVDLINTHTEYRIKERNMPVGVVEEVRAHIYNSCLS